MRRLFTILFVVFTSLQLSAQTVFWTHDFESSGGYTNSDTESSDGGADYYGRFSIDDISATFTNIQGTYFFAVQDKDAAPTPVNDPAYIEFTSIDISGKSDLSFSVYLAEDDDGTDQDWDATDYVHFYYQIDGGGYQNLLWIENDGSTYNSAPYIDTDFDGTGDGAEITDEFTKFTATISGTGSSLDIKVEFGGLTSGDEDIAIDQLELTDNSTTPVELSSFTAVAKGNVVELQWNTATEVNNYGFEVERVNSENKVWETIGFVEGAGNSNSPKEYSYTDNVNTGGKYTYRLKQIDLDGSFKYSNAIEVNVGTPAKFELSQNYPNPFNPTTTIKYSVAKEQVVTLKIYDMLGREVATLVNAKKVPGNYKVNFDASKLTSGIYFYRLQSGNFVDVKKMTLMK